MIKRDLYGIVVQHNFEQPDAPFDTEAQGDSAARTGPLAAAGSVEDMRLTNLFVLPSGQLVRHPYSPKWSDPTLTSRDQLVQFCVSRSFAAARAARYYLEQGRINKDWLSPSVRLYLHRVALTEPSMALKLAGNVNLWIDLIWNTLIRPNEELNQFICMCIVLGPYWSKKLLDFHPNLEHNLFKYWGNWRDQTEIGQALLNTINKGAKNENT